MSRIIDICCASMVAAILSRCIMPSGHLRGHDENGSDNMLIHKCPFCGEQARFIFKKEIKNEINGI